MTDTHVKITINGREYTSLDDVPESFRHLIEGAMANALASKSGTGTAVRTTLTKLLPLSANLPFELQPKLLSPGDYRRQIEAQQSGSAPAAFAGEDSLWTALWAALAITVAGFFAAAMQRPPIAWAAPVFVLLLTVCILGLVGLWTRRQRRLLYPVLSDLADRVSGGFIAVFRGEARFFVARDAWHGSAAFSPGSKYQASYSRFDATTQPSRVELALHTRTLFEKIAGSLGGQTGTTGLAADAEFDRHFVATCSDSGVAGKMLDDRVRDALDRLRTFGDVSVTVRGNAVRVNVHQDLALMHRKSRQQKDQDALEQFLTDACTIVDAAAAIR